jgi:hypothetical protein
MAGASASAGGLSASSRASQPKKLARVHRLDLLGRRGGASGR